MAKTQLDTDLLNLNQSVGIGSPASLGATQAPTFSLRNYGTVAQYRLIFNHGGSGLLGIGSDGVGAMIFGKPNDYNGTPSSEYARFDANGNFGLGTNNPAAKLDVFGNYVKIGNASYTGYLGGGNGIATGGVATDFGVRSDTNLIFVTGTAERARIDASGNLLVGTTSGTRKLEVAGNAAFGRSGMPVVIKDNAGTDYGNDIYLPHDGGSSTQRAFRLRTSYNAGSARFSIGRSTNSSAYNTDVSALTYVDDVAIDGSGNLLVGVATASAHRFEKAVTNNAGNAIFGLGSQGASSMIVFGTGQYVPNAANCSVALGRDNNTLRSLNASGTLNASGADYAEYYHKADTCGEVAKGQIVGINAEGKLTDKWAESISFLIKSTDPSYVGGDTWGSEAALGCCRPDEPVRRMLVTERQLVAEAVPERLDEDGNVLVPAVEAQYTDVVVEPGDSDDEWQAKQDAYAAALAEFNAKLEAARQKVDRIAFAGQVPVNVYGAQPGDYIVPVQDGEGIAGTIVADADITFAQYRKAVGVVQNLLPDGRANVRVKPV